MSAMASISNRWQNAAYTGAGLLILRVGFGLTLALLHGRGKLAAAAGYLFAGHDWEFVKTVSSLGFPLPGLFAVLAALSEGLGGLLLALGLFTRFASAAIVFTLLVAVTFHVRGGQSPELAVAYVLGSLTVLLAGPGEYSLDGLLARRKDAGRDPLDAGEASAV
jgi:putative oxidoreductase